MKQNRKTKSLLMLGIILAVLAVAGIACVGAGAAAGGIGTEDEPYQITSVDELTNFLNDTTKGEYGK